MIKYNINESVFQKKVRYLLVAIRNVQEVCQLKEKLFSNIQEGLRVQDSKYYLYDWKRLLQSLSQQRVQVRMHPAQHKSKNHIHW